MPLRNMLISVKFTTIGVLALAAAASVLPGCTSPYSDKRVFADEANENRDIYPDFSKPLTSAMPQMSNEEADKQEAQLSHLAAQRKSGAISEAEYNRRVEELRKLNRQVQAQK